MINQHLEKLRDLYVNNNLVPFIGAGLSYPFNIPTWEGLINEIKKNVDPTLQPSVNWYLERKEYWKSVELIKDFNNYDELDLQHKVADIIQDKEEDAGNNEHNYFDLGEMDFNLYLTTNYDNWLYPYLKGKKTMPLNLQRVGIGSESLLNPKRKTIVHLHGNLSEPDNIVLTQSSYNKLYEDENYNKLFGLLSGSKTFIFLGFSFDDRYIRDLFTNFQEYFKRTHYILLNNPTSQTIREFKDKYKLEVIPYNSNGIGHVKAIRRILNNIKLSAKNIQEKITLMHGLIEDNDDLLLNHYSDVGYDIYSELCDNPIPDEKMFNMANDLAEYISAKKQGVIEKAIKVDNEVYLQVNSFIDNLITLSSQIVSEIIWHENKKTPISPEYFINTYMQDNYSSINDYLKNYLKELEKELAAKQ
ncbi:SIR2 family NAD-dependent protein deacylase [Peribacillus frigoritolerans]